MRIAVPIVGPTMKDALRDIDEASEVADILELRLDLIEDMSGQNDMPGRDDLERLMKRSDVSKIVTDRNSPENVQRAIVMEKGRAVSEAEYADSDLEQCGQITKYLTKLIISAHDFKKTPENLGEKYQEIMEKNPDILKMAYQANCFKDVTRMLGLVFESKIPMIGLSMDDKDNPVYVTKDDLNYFQREFRGLKEFSQFFWKGLDSLVDDGITLSGFSRTLSPAYGGYLTFAALSKQKKSAPGQLTVYEVKENWKRLGFD